MRTEAIHRQRLMVRVISQDRQTSAHRFDDMVHRHAVSARDALNRGLIKESLRLLLQAQDMRFTDQDLREITTGLCEKAILSHNQINATCLAGAHLYQLRIDPSVEEYVPVGDNDNTSEQMKARG